MRALIAVLIRRLCFFLCLLTSTGLIHAQTPVGFSRVFLFGDSLLDTYSVYNATNAICNPNNDPTDTCLPYPGSPEYDGGIFTDGLSTQPAAQRYFSLWNQQLTVLLQGVGGINVIAPGKDYAWGYATTQNGTSNVAAGSFNITIENMGQQVADYIGSGDVPSSSTLYVLFGGMNDLIASPTTSSAEAAAQRLTALVQQLAAFGATTFLIPNQPPLTAYPNAQYSTAAAAFNTALTADLATLQTQQVAGGHPITITQVDLFSLFTAIADNPSAHGFTDVTTAAQSLPSSADPDTYLSWDGINPTTAGHYQIAYAACTALTQTLTTLAISSATATVANPATLTATVSTAGTYGTPVATGQPTGSITFYNNTIVIGTATLENGVATFSSSSLGNTNYANITAVYSGDTHFHSGCVSNAVALSISSATVGYVINIVTNPSYVALDELPITNVFAQSVGGFTGSVTFSCGELPQNFQCQWTNATTQVLSNGTIYYAQLIVQTGYSVSAVRPPGAIGHGRSALAFAALLALPLAWFIRRRHSIAHLLLLCVAFSMLLGLTACGGVAAGGGGTPPPKTYTYPSPGWYYLPIIGTSNGVQTRTTFSIYISDGL